MRFQQCLRRWSPAAVWRPKVRPVFLLVEHGQQFPFPHLFSPLGHGPQIQSTSEAPKQCAAACKEELTCVGFTVRSTSTTASECCLFNFTDRQRTLPKHGAAYFSMPQCESCKAGYGKLWRQCVPLSPAPRLEDGRNLIELYIPEGTPAGTFVHSLRAAYQTFGHGSLPRSAREGWHFTIEASEAKTVNGSGPLTVDTMGRLHLAEPFTQPTSAVVVVTDSSTECIRQLPGSTMVEIVGGGCQARLMVALHTASFLNCPASMEAFSSDGQAVDVEWEDPILPPYLANLTVTRSLGNTSSTASPYRYSVGRHRVTYVTQLPVLGPLSCSFDVIVLEGLGLTVQKVLDVPEAGIAQQYLVAEPALTTEGVAALQDLQLNSDGAFRVGLRHADRRQFHLQAQVP